jgi:hypothetical protein
MLVSRYINPATKGHLVRAGRYVKVPAPVAWAYNQVMLRRGSVPGYPNMGSRIHTVTHAGAGVARRIEAMVDEVLRPGVGTRFQRYERVVWMDAAGRPVIDLTIYVEGRPHLFSIPLAEGDAGAI